MSEETQTEKPAYRTCPIGFLVHSDNRPDPNRGCGYRHCYESACNWIKSIKKEEQCD